MAVILKRSNGHVPQECLYRCCTELYGRNIPKIRRSIKRREDRAWREDQENN